MVGAFRFAGSWEAVDATLERGTWFAVWGVSDANVWIAGGSCFHNFFNGVWRTVACPNDATIRGVWGAVMGVWFVGDRGALFWVQWDRAMPDPSRRLRRARAAFN